MVEEQLLSRYATAVGLFSFIVLRLASSDPQAYFLGQGCSSYNVSVLATFNANLNASFNDVKAKIGTGSRFVTSQQLTGSDPVYVMLQCRDYMTNSDCLSCFSTASLKVRNCSSHGANGGRVIYDGCFLRYERNNFFGEGTTDANRGICGNKNSSISPAKALKESALGLLTDLQTAAPNTRNFYAASLRLIAGVSPKNASVYAFAQCVHTIDKAGCQACLKVAYNNIQLCLTDSGGRAIDSGCFMRYSDSPIFSANQSMNLAPLLKTGSSSKAALIGGIAGGGAAAIFIVVAVLFWRRESKRTPPKADILGATELRGPVNYSYKDLKAATGNFKDANKLGEGGFGEVYKGTLKNGKVVAVKKLALAQSRRAMEDFVSEVTLISNVHHRNLVRLLGCCGKGPELLLVYEYMANKSLDRYLFGQKHGGTLTWKQRFDVILGTAQGLAYLHEQFHVCIIHRDIKPSNILLDEDFQAKIADFGLVKLLPENQSHVSTRFAGTLGYTAPEYAVHGQLSEKADTYSYGVVVLETVSGKRSSELMDEPGADYLLKRAWRLYESRMHIELVDKSLKDDEYEVEEVAKVIEIALMCTQSSASLRPTMSEVVVMLKHRGPSEARQLTSPPFIDGVQRVSEDKSTSTASSKSNAVVTISQLSGR